MTSIILNNYTSPGAIDTSFHSTYTDATGYISVRLWCNSRTDNLLIILYYADDDQGLNVISESYLAIGANATSISSLLKKPYIRTALFPITPNTHLGQVNLLTKAVPTTTHPSLSYVTDAVTANVSVALDDIRLVPDITDACCSILVYGSSQAGTNGDNHIILTDTMGRTVVSGPNIVNTLVDTTTVRPLLIGGLYNGQYSQFAQTDDNGYIYTHIGSGTNTIGKVGIDQTSNTVTLAAGTNIVGRFGIDQVTSGANTVTLGAGSSTIGGVSITAPIPSGTNIVGRVGIDQVTAGANTVTLGAGLASIGSISSIVSPLPSGSNIVGRVGIDQATAGANVVTLGAGTTTIVSNITDPLPSGTNIVGRVGIDQATAGANVVILGAGSSSIGNITSITNSLPVGANIIGRVGIDQTAGANVVTLGAGSALIGGISGITNALPTGANIIGRVGIDQTLGANTVTLGAGTNLMGKVGIDQVTAGANTVTLGAGTNLMGKVGIDQVTSGANVVKLAAGTAAIGSLTAGSADIGTVHVKNSGGSVNLSGSLSNSSVSFSNGFLYKTFTIFGSSDTDAILTVQFNTLGSGWIDSIYTINVAVGVPFTLNLANVAVDQIRISSSVATSLVAYMCYST